MALTENMIKRFKAIWHMANPLISDNFLDARIDKIKKEHEYMDELKKDKEPETKVIYISEKPESQLKKYSDATFIIVIILIILALADIL